MGFEVGVRALDGVYIDREWPLALTTFFGASDALILNWSSRFHQVFLNEYQSIIRSITFFFNERWSMIVIVLITTPPIDEDRRLRKESLGDDTSR
ncbi:GDSL esterase/lipase [Dendrobium catenatum]|uniref:GDSL esterase/lipase n=1 Tax=Dendrobium catenatum TaxID=906689 RepID=A0A2I0W2M4_9ASPA|nr:GDSL esterase/lipase [Dendrobium catenatum]